MLRPEGYQDRLIDKKIQEYLKVFGAIAIEGPKWCGKTWTAKNNGNSIVCLNNTENNFRDLELAQMDVNLVLGGEHPAIIDEWQEVPAIWDAVRYKCDQDKEKGKYILTGSATPVDNKIKHSGAGRIVRMNMYPMSLYESKESSGDVSIKDLFENNVKNKVVSEISLKHLAEIIVRGGWPELINVGENEALKVNKSYIDDILKKDISSIDGKQRDQEKMKMLLRSLARNESTISPNATLVRDIETSTNEEELTVTRNTIAEYLDVLDRLHLIDNQRSFKYKIRSKANVGKVDKRHFVDPSLGCAILNISSKKLMQDLETFGLYFEALVERDLRIYMDYLDGALYHYRDSNNLEVDAIVEIADGEYGAIEIKLGSNKIDEAVENLSKFYENAEIKPKFMAVICGLYNAVVRRQDGIYILPITALKP